MKGLLEEEAQVQEMTLAMAQSAVWLALERSKIRKGELARRLRVSPPYVSNLLGRGENMTVKQLGRVLWAMGFEVRFKLVRRA